MNELINECELELEPNRLDAAQLKVDYVAYAALWTHNLSTPKTQAPGEVASAFRVFGLHASHVAAIPASI